MRKYYLIGQNKKGDTLIDSGSDRVALKARFQEVITNESEFDIVKLIGEGDRLKSGRPRCQMAKLEAKDNKEAKSKIKK